MNVVVTGGGTGGHIYPALAIADKIKEKYPESNILYIGAKGGLEERIVAEHGYDIETIEVKGFIRKLSIENIKRVIMAGCAILKAKKIIKDFEADVVIGTGGYVSGPVVLAANNLKILTAIHEQNAFPGLTNKLLAKRSKLIFIGFEDARERFKTKNPVIYVGNPVRDNLLQKTKIEARQELGIPVQKKMILIVGGSGGQKSLNDSFVKLFDTFVEKDYAFIHITGKRFFLDVEYELSDKVKKGYQRIKDYEIDIPKAMIASDLIICSAGASTIAEVSAMGKASIIIPKKYTSENHQEYNAKIVSKNGAGRYILESELDEEILLKNIEEILDDENLRTSMELESKKLYKKNTLEKMIEEIEKRLNVN